jgi:hypothetical protein
MKDKNMALYKNANYLTVTSDSAFDTLHKPGETTPHSGIFRCEGADTKLSPNRGNQCRRKIITRIATAKVTFGGV